MPSSLYDRLKIGSRASHTELIRAYQREVAELVARIQSARQHGADSAPLEHQKRELQEAKSILLDPHRRRRYDAYISRMHTKWPSNAAELWDEQKNEIIDPRVLSALEFVRATTNFQLGNLLEESVAPENQTQPIVAPSNSEKAPTPRHAVPSFDPEATEMMPSHVDQTVARASIPAPPAKQQSLPALIKKHGHTGRFLKSVREQRGQSIDELSELTQITKEMLIALEHHQFDRLPALLYVKGWLSQLEEELELEETNFAAQFYAMLVRRRQRPS